MPGPSNTTPLDDFNRANGALGANWLVVPGSTMPTINTNQASVGTAAYVSASWTAGTFTGGKYEVYVTLGTKPSGTLTNGLWVGVWLGGGTPNTTQNLNGYELDLLTQASGNQRFQLYRNDGSVSQFTPVQLGSNVDTTFAAGDAMMLVVDGSSISGYRRVSGTWDSSPIISATDATYSGTAYLYAGMTDSASGSGRYDDFGGGVHSAASGTTYTKTGLVVIGP